MAKIPDNYVEKLRTRVESVMRETQEALQLIWDNTNKGQRKQMLKNPEVKALMERYKVDTGDN